MNKITKKSKKIIIYRPDEETICFYVDYVHIGSATHDEHGWTGMQTIEAIVLGLAKLFKIPVVEGEK